MTLDINGIDLDRRQIMDILDVGVGQPNDLFAALNSFESGGAFYGMSGRLDKLGNGWVLLVMDDGAVEARDWFSDDGTRSIDVTMTEYGRLVR